jgi:hypothetical protein
MDYGMTTVTIPLFTDEIDKIKEILEKFPEATMVTLTRDTGNGIGYTLTAAVPYSHDDMTGTFTTEITGVDSW